MQQPWCQSFPQACAWPELDVAKLLASAAYRPTPQYSMRIMRSPGHHLAIVTVTDISTLQML